jgi:CBS domain-containing protein
MATVKEVIARKGSQVYTVPASATVLEATQKMNEYKIGALIVTDSDRLMGIFTERDVLRRIVVEQRPPSTTLVRDVMTRELLCCRPDTDLDEASRVMKDRRVRHLPVCEGDQLLGMLSIGDINAYHASHQEATIHILSEYLYAQA